MAPEDREFYERTRSAAIFAYGVYVAWWVRRGLDFWSLPGVDKIITERLKLAIKNWENFGVSMPKKYVSAAELSAEGLSGKAFLDALEKVEVKKRPDLLSFLAEHRGVIERHLKRGVSWPQIVEVLVRLKPEYKDSLTARKLATAFSRVKRIKKLRGSGADQLSEDEAQDNALDLNLEAFNT